MASSKYNISAVNRITGKSRTTITQHIKTGKLSAENDANGNKVIDAAELIRVYGDLCHFDAEQGRGTNGPKSQPMESHPSQDLKRLQEQLDREVTERTRERQQYREQVEHLQEALTRAQDGQNRVTLLLENQAKGAGEWKQAFQVIEQRLTEQQRKTEKEITELREAAKQKIAGYKKALEEERQKTFWQRLWSD